jgi:hypothetical protein
MRGLGMCVNGRSVETVERLVFGPGGVPTAYGLASEAALHGYAVQSPLTSQHPR